MLCYDSVMILNLDALRAGQPAAQHALHCEVFQRNGKQHEATAFKSIKCKPSNIGANPMSFFTFWELLAVASVHLAEIQQEDGSAHRLTAAILKVGAGAL